MMLIHREKNTREEQGCACVYAQEWAHTQAVSVLDLEFEIFVE